MIYYLIYILVACYTKLSVHVYEGEESFYLFLRVHINQPSKMVDLCALLINGPACSYYF